MSSEGDGPRGGQARRTGLLSWKMKRLWDETMGTKVEEGTAKIACAFSSAGGLGRRQNSPAIECLPYFSIWILVSESETPPSQEPRYHYGDVAGQGPGEATSESCEFSGAARRMDRFQVPGRKTSIPRRSPSLAWTLRTSRTVTPRPRAHHFTILPKKTVAIARDFRRAIGRWLDYSPRSCRKTRGLDCACGNGQAPSTRRPFGKVSHGCQCANKSRSAKAHPA